MLATLEVCVDTLEGALTAKAGGAARVELCSSLSEGGLTPSAGLMRAAKHSGIPCFAMIRPRSGLFRFSAGEEAIMLEDILVAREAGLPGVVLGAQDETGGLDVPMLRRLSVAAGGIQRTLHRVIDVVPDPLAALDQAMALGFDRVLTSGGAAEAPDGQEAILRMVERAEGRLSVMPGCGLTPGNVAVLVRKTGVREVHAACATPVENADTFSDFDPPSGRMKTDLQAVRDMVAALAPASGP